ncbi:MAG: Ldh family oxidoreductase [Chloroflexi bacterium]|nr:Ldh family oxidoreductase [Chloroflexota bacterium]
MTLGDTMSAAEYHTHYTTEQIPLVRVPYGPLRELIRQLMRRTPLSPEDADIIADALVFSELTNLQGQGQGSRRAPFYVQRAVQGQLNTRTQFEIVKESPALALVDAHNGSGTVIAVRAMHLAVDKARQCGVGAVMVRHSTHFGSASISAMQALPHGCIGVSLTNAGPEMAPWGGIDPVLGTNPWGVAIPTGDSEDDMPIILDMAITMAGKGMMRWLLRDGRKMPATWAITRDGRATDDPAEALDGTLLPIGEYKGYGLSLITDVLTGVLSGSGYGIVPFRDQARQDVGHQFIAYDIGWFMDRTEFYRRMADFIAMVKGSRVRPGFGEILLPGELEWRRMQEKKRNGVPLDPDAFDALRKLSAELGVPWPFA